jgi:hypothetical protein
MTGPRRLNEPRAVAVHADDDGTPRAVGPSAVEVAREEWLVEDRWWTPHPLRRHYYELVLADGRVLTVFRIPDALPPYASKRRGGESGSGRWFCQRA